MPETVHLIDASPYVFRAWFALPSSMTDPAGRPVNAVYGFVGFLVKYVGERRPSHLAVAFDRSLTTSFRNEIYPDYKAGRELPPAALEDQLEDCRQAAAALGAAVFDDERYEADDLIGTLVARLAPAGHQAIVVTSDKDLAQLVDERVRLLDYARGVEYDEATVAARFGVRPGQIADLLALAGDPVDNIPGVRGVGPKTAAALLAEFDHLEDVYADLDRVAALPLRGARSLRRRLAEGRESASLSKRLATIARDAPLRAGLADLRFRGPDPARLDPLFERLGFEGLRERVLGLGG